jgi:hypothetical protein
MAQKMSKGVCMTYFENGGMKDCGPGMVKTRDGYLEVTAGKLTNTIDIVVSKPPETHFNAGTIECPKRFTWEILGWFN